MLDKLSEKILKYCIKHYDKKTEKPIEINLRDFGIGLIMYNSVIKLLTHLAYIHSSDYAYENDDTCKIYLTSKGLSYLKTKRIEQFRFWFPIYLSAIATLISIGALIVSIMQLKK